MSRGVAYTRERCTKRTEAVEIFEKLKHDPCYRNGFYREKLSVIKKLVEIKYELKEFAAYPNRKLHEINGFFVECCARFSKQLPKNSPKANEFSETILTYLKKRRLCNSDYLWLKIRGKRITINGIGEVKSHLRSIKHNPNQLLLQEQSIYGLVGSHRISFLLPTSHHIVLEENFMRYLILPRSIHLPYVLPPSVPLGWNIKEIEFTFQEILFLKQFFVSDIFLPEDISQKILICPTDQYILCSNEIIGRTRKVILDFFGHLPFIYEERHQDALIIWSLLAHSVPVSQESILQVIQWIIPLINDLRRNQKNIMDFLLIPPFSLIELDEKEQRSLHSIMMRVVNSETHVVHAFLSRIKEFRQKLPPFPKLDKKVNIDIFSIL